MVAVVVEHRGVALTQRLIADHFETRPLGELSLKGKAASVDAWEVVSRRAARSRLEIESERGLTPLAGRAEELQQLLERESLDLAKSYFYTDSITDQPLLDLVGHPIIVNPDPLLYREARRRRWPVRIFANP